MQARALSLMAVLAVTALPLPLGAQRPTPTRTGQWLGFGIGTGFGRVSCAICRSNRHASISGFVRGGGTLNRHTLLGVEGNGWMRRDDNVDEFLVAVSAVFSWYPNPRRRLFYKGGLSVMLYQADDGPNRLTSTAFGPEVGAGYDIPLSPSVSFTPFASWHIASLGGDLKYNGEKFRDDIGLMLIQIGAGITWH